MCRVTKENILKFLEYARGNLGERMEAFSSKCFKQQLTYSETRSECSWLVTRARALYRLALVHKPEEAKDYLSVQEIFADMLEKVEHRHHVGLEGGLS